MGKHDGAIPNLPEVLVQEQLNSVGVRACERVQARLCHREQNDVKRDEAETYRPVQLCLCSHAQAHEAKSNDSGQQNQQGDEGQRCGLAETDRAVQALQSDHRLGQNAGGRRHHRDERGDGF